MSGKRKRSAVRGRRSSTSRPAPTPTIGLDSRVVEAAMEIADGFWAAERARWSRDQFGGRA